MLRIRTDCMIQHALFIITIYKNNGAKIWPKIKNNVRTIQAGIWNHKCKVYFSQLSSIISSNSNVSSVKILQMLRSIEFPLRFFDFYDEEQLKTN